MSRTLHNFLIPNDADDDEDNVIIMAIFGSHKVEEFEGDIFCGNVLSSTLID
jgi:hypothetical protein